MEQHGKRVLRLVNGQTQWEENELRRSRFFSDLLLHREKTTLFYNCYKLLLHENTFFFWSDCINALCRYYMYHT